MNGELRALLAGWLAGRKGSALLHWKKGEIKACFKGICGFEILCWFYLEIPPAARCNRMRRDGDGSVTLKLGVLRRFFQRNEFKSLLRFSFPLDLVCW